MNNRLKKLKIVIIIIMAILVLRAGYLQIIKGSYYKELSEGNRTSLRPINAPRGKIIDSNNNIIASNKLSYDLYLLPNEIPPEFNALDVINNLKNYTDFNISKIEDIYNENNDIYNSSILLKRNISSQNMVAIEENKNVFPGLVIEDSFLRKYHYNDIASHIIGHIGQISNHSLEEFNAQGRNYESGDIIGVSALEKEYEEYLNGVRGIEQIEVDSLGNKIKTLAVKPPQPGNDIILNIDFRLEQEVHNLLNDKYFELREEAKEDEELTIPTGASAIVMEVNTGAIKAMVSIPNYNPNKFVGGISQNEYNSLQNDPDFPLLNRNIKSAVPPGSIFKLVTGTAALEYLDVNADTEFVDNNAKFYVPGWSQPYRNWNPVGEGRLDFVKAIARSNNIIFYKLGYRLYEEYRGEKLIETAKEYGLGSKTGIDLPNEKSGLVPDEKWKREKFNQGWYPGDSVNLSIGQGGLLTTPLQLATMVSSIANEGLVYEPQLVDKIISSEGEIILDNDIKIKKELSFSNSTYKTLKEGMIDVANKDYGTASSVLGDSEVKIAGKTGTAQTGRSNHGWFAGMAPADNPEIVVVVFIENGNSSSNTLEVAKGIFSEYFSLEKMNEE